MSLIIFTILTSFFIKHGLSDIIVYARNSGQIVEEFRDLPARFGPSLPSTGLRFIAIGADPKNGCSKIEPPPDRNITSIKWVVLIARNNCSFDDKVRAAQSAGYDACIVYNVGSNDLEQMSAKNSDGILIPSVFVGERTGQILIFNYEWNAGFALIINDDLPFNINTHLIVPFSIVVGLCFIIMIAFMIVKCVRDQRRLRRHRLPSGLLKKIPTIKYGKTHTYETCAICLDDYIEGDRLRVLPCSHAYHTKCIDPWLTKNRRVCPICKRKVFARGEQRPRRRRSSSDSMSDSDVDDRTPLLNPVENSSNHGTFGIHATSGSNVSVTSNVQIGESGSNQVYPQRRINPFDRVLTVQNQTTENNNRLRWERFKSLFTRTPTESPPITTQSDLFNSRNTVLINTIPIAQPVINSQNVLMERTSSSNNILNKNLSGSFNPEDEADDDDESDDDDMLTDNNNTDTIILRNDNIQHGLIGVVALPNNNFNQLSLSSNDEIINNSRRSNSDPYIV